MCIGLYWKLFDTEFVYRVGILFFNGFLVLNTDLWFTDTKSINHIGVVMVSVLDSSAVDREV